jgi:hypothetical protein
MDMSSRAQKRALFGGAEFLIMIVLSLIKELVKNPEKKKQFKRILLMLRDAITALYADDLEPRRRSRPDPGGRSRPMRTQ